MILLGHLVGLRGLSFIGQCSYLCIVFLSLSFFKPLGTCIIMPDEVFRISPGLASLRLRTSKEGLDSSASVWRPRREMLESRWRPTLTAVLASIFVPQVLSPWPGHVCLLTLDVLAIWDFPSRYRCKHLATLKLCVQMQPSSKLRLLNVSSFQLYHMPHQHGSYLLFHFVLCMENTWWYIHDCLDGFLNLFALK